MLPALPSPPPTFRLVPYRVPVDARLRRLSMLPVLPVTDTGNAVRVRLDGQDVGGAPESADVVFAPCAAPGGLAGTVRGFVSGARTAGTQLGFYAPRKGKPVGFPDYEVAGVSRGGDVLLLRQDEFQREGYADAGDAFVWRAGRRLPVGLAEAAWIAGDGTVVGVALARPQGSYIGRYAASAEYPSLPETFVWREGVRTVSPGWWPATANVHGAVLGFAAGVPYDRPVGPLVRWEKGRLTRLPIGGDPACEPFFARDDGSFVFGVTTPLGRRLAILSNGRLERVPARLSNVDLTLDQIQIQIDPRGRIWFEKEGHRWQIVRAPRPIRRSYAFRKKPL